MNKALHLFDKASEAGWRRMFCWTGSVIVLMALKIAFIDLPMTGQIMPEYYYFALASLLTLWLGVLGLRGLEKHSERKNELATKTFYHPDGGPRAPM